MPGTLSVAVRKAVTDSLAELPELATAQVMFAWKADSQHRRRIYTRRAAFTHAAASLRPGRNYRDEVGTFDVVLLIEGVAQTQEETSQQAVDLGVFVEEWIADHKSGTGLGVEGLLTLQVAGDGELNEMFNDAGTLAELSYPVRFTARLT